MIKYVIGQEFYFSVIELSKGRPCAVYVPETRQWQIIHLVVALSRKWQTMRDFVCRPQPYHPVSLRRPRTASASRSSTGTGWRDRYFCKPSTISNRRSLGLLHEQQRSLKFVFPIKFAKVYSVMFLDYFIYHFNLKRLISFSFISINVSMLILCHSFYKQDQFQNRRAWVVLDLSIDKPSAVDVIFLKLCKWISTFRKIKRVLKWYTAQKASRI